MQKTTEWLLLIVALSILVKAELANETGNYGTKTEACTNLSQKCKLTKKESPCEIWTGFRSSRSDIFFKVGVLKTFLNSRGKHLCWGQSWNLEGSIKKRLQHRCFPVKCAKIFWTSSLIEQLQRLLLTFSSYFHRCPERKPVRLSAIYIRFSWKKVFADVKISTPMREIIPEFFYHLNLVVS